MAGWKRWIAAAVVLVLPACANEPTPVEDARSERAGSSQDRDGSPGRPMPCLSPGRCTVGVGNARTFEKHIRPGGPPVRFRMRLNNPSRRPMDDARLWFEFPAGDDPVGPVLERRGPSGWENVPLTPYDPDTAETIRSEPVAVEVKPLWSRPFDFRLRLPASYRSDFHMYRAVTVLEGVGLTGDDGERQPGRGLFRYIGGPKWWLDQDERARMTLSGPPTLMIGAAPAKFTVAIDNQGRARNSVRVDLKLRGMGGLPEFAKVEALRAGTWRRLEPEDRTRIEPTFRLTEPFEMPNGHQSDIQFRITLNTGLVRIGELVYVLVSLRNTDPSAAHPSLARGVLYPKLATR